MQRNSKLPVGMTEIARLMEVNSEELMAWPFFEEVRTLFKEYNRGRLVKQDLLAKLKEIENRCKNDNNLFVFANGVATAISAVKVI